MTIGSRVIAGEIREREQAQREYVAARNEGRKAALVEQQRPNVFTTSVSGLMPDEEAVIEIAYQETAHYENGEYSLRFPMVVMPRYTPQHSDPLAVAAALPPSHDVLNSYAFAGNVAISVELEPGYSLRNISSLHHKIVTETLGNQHYRALLDATFVPPDRDFELTWQPDLGSTPEAAVLTEKVGDETYALVLVTPPEQSPVRLPRETVFIIDSSGSMQGASMDQAKVALLLAIDNLKPGDRFNIIDFDSEARSLFPDSTLAAPDTIERAKNFVVAIKADGGTEMLKALKLAFPEHETSHSGTVRQVIFMTDGQVGNEQELFKFINDHLGESRLFTVGIGAAPNSHFMRNAARFGRGTFTYIGNREQVQQRMGDLFARLDSPAMTSIALSVSDPTAAVWPARVPDLYSGEPLVVAVQLHDPKAKVTLRGMIGTEPWQKELTLTASIEDAGVGKLWARQKIESLMDSLSEGNEPNVVRADVVQVAMQHHLVSQYTSLVAVDRTPQGLGTTSCKPERVGAPSNSVDPDDGTLPQTATPAFLLLLLGALMSVSALILRRWIN
jgi:Ca-activated chloride channel family protein